MRVASRLVAVALTFSLAAPFAGAVDPNDPYDPYLELPGWFAYGTCAVDALGTGAFCVENWWNLLTQECMPGESHWTCTLQLYQPMAIVTRWIGEAEGTLTVSGVCNTSVGFHVEDAEIRRVYSDNCAPVVYTLPNDFCEHASSYSMPLRLETRVEGELATHEDVRELTMDLWNCE